MTLIKNCFGATLALLIFVLFLSNVQAYKGSVNVDRLSISNENCGGTAEVKVILNNNGGGGALCWWQLDTEPTWKKATYSCVSPRGGSQTFVVKVPMLIYPSLTQNRILLVECRDYWAILWDTCDPYREYWDGGHFSTKSWSFIISTDCTGFIATQNILVLANNSIEDAEKSVIKAQEKINEAIELGLKDVTDPINLLNRANTTLSTAKMYLEQANQWFSTNLLDDAKLLAQQSQNFSQTSKDYAEQSFSLTNHLIQEFMKKMNEALIKISEANTSTTNAILMLNKADDALRNVSLVNQYVEIIAELEIISPKVNLSDAKAKLDQSIVLLEAARKAFENKDFDYAINQSSFAKQLADEANDIAFKVYSPINTIILTLGEVGKAVIAAADEINKTDNILTKSQFLIRSVKKWNVNISEVESIVISGQASIDEAKSLLSKARNRVQLGIASEAINFAIQAKDKASEPTNKLERIRSNFLMRIQDALEEDLKNTKRQIKLAEIELEGASNTYMAAQEKILDAQDSITEAKLKLAEAVTVVSEIKDSTDIESLVNSAVKAFSALEIANEHIKSSMKSSQEAKMGLYATTAAIGVTVAGTLGGGFLWYKKKMKVSPGKPAEMETSG